MKWQRVTIVSRLVCLLFGLGGLLVASLECIRCNEKDRARKACLWQWRHCSRIIGDRPQLFYD